MKRFLQLSFATAAFLTCCAHPPLWAGKHGIEDLEEDQSPLAKRAHVDLAPKKKPS